MKKLFIFVGALVGYSCMAQETLVPVPLEEELSIAGTKINGAKIFCGNSREALISVPMDQLPSGISERIVHKPLVPVSKEEKVSVLCSDSPEAQELFKQLIDLQKTIREVETNPYEFVGKTFVLTGRIDFSTLFQCGYEAAKDTHFAFFIEQNPHDRAASLYMEKSQAAELRKQLLAAKGPINGTFLVQMLPGKTQDSAGLYLELLKASPPISRENLSKRLADFTDPNCPWK